MRVTDLPSPGIGQRSVEMQKLMAAAISQLEIVAAKYADGKHPEAGKFSEFLTAALAAVNAIKPA